MVGPTGVCRAACPYLGFTLPLSKPPEALPLRRTTTLPWLSLPPPLPLPPSPMRWLPPPPRSPLPPLPPPSRWLPLPPSPLGPFLFCRSQLNAAVCFLPHFRHSVRYGQVPVLWPARVPRRWPFASRSHAWQNSPRGLLGGGRACVTSATGTAPACPSPPRVPGAGVGAATLAASTLSAGAGADSRWSPRSWGRALSSFLRDCFSQNALHCRRTRLSSARARVERSGSERGRGS